MKKWERAVSATAGVYALWWAGEAGLRLALHGGVIELTKVELVWVVFIVVVRGVDWLIEAVSGVRS